MRSYKSLAEVERAFRCLKVINVVAPASRRPVAEVERAFRCLKVISVVAPAPRRPVAEVERAFRCLKGVELLVRPIRHLTEDRVPAHIFLCVLAYYVEWHLRRAWAPLLFEEEERREERKHRDPVLPAKPSAAVQRKKRSHQTPEGLPVHSFRNLLGELASRARVTYALKAEKAEEEARVTFRQVPEPTPLQGRAYELIRTFTVTGG